MNHKTFNKDGIPPGHFSDRASCLFYCEDAEIVYELACAAVRAGQIIE